jgi:predicted N-acyltransferase
MPALICTAETMCRDAGLSSAHATFIEPEQVAAFEKAGWLIRHDIQFHWANAAMAGLMIFWARCPLTSARICARSGARRRMAC